MTNRFIQKREATIQVILEVGLKLFADNGFHQTTIRMIAEKAGISLGLLYNYFKSKEEVLQAIFRKTIPEIQTSFIALNQPDQKITLRLFIRHYVQSLKTNPDFWRLSCGLRLSSITAAIIMEEMEEFNSTIYGIIKSCLVDEDIPFPSLEAKFILAALDGLTHHFLLQEKYPVDDLVNLMLMKYQN